MTMFAQVPNQPHDIHHNHQRRGTFAANNDAGIEESKECGNIHAVELIGRDNAEKLFNFLHDTIRSPFFQNQSSRLYKNTDTL